MQSLGLAICPTLSYCITHLHIQAHGLTPCSHDVASKVEGLCRPLFPMAITISWPGYELNHHPPPNNFYTSISGLALLRLSCRQVKLSEWGKRSREKETRKGNSKVQKVTRCATYTSSTTLVDAFVLVVRSEIENRSDVETGSSISSPFLVRVSFLTLVSTISHRIYGIGKSLSLAPHGYLSYACPYIYVRMFT